MFKIFKPYMLLLLILLASSSIVMAQDCDNCPIGYICEGDECVVGVDLDRDLDGVPDALDSCPDLSNPPQKDRDMDGIGDACDDDVQAGAQITGRVRHFPNHAETGSPLPFAGVKIQELDIQTQADEFGQYSLIHVPVGEWTIEVYPPMGDFGGLALFDREPIHISYMSIAPNMAYEPHLRDLLIRPTGQFRGRVSPSGETYGSYSEVTVTIITEDENFEVYTDRAGDFVSPYLNEGSYRVNFSKEGYQPLSREVEVIGLNMNHIGRLELQRIACQNINCFNKELIDYFGLRDYDNALLAGMESVEFAENNFKGLDAQMALAYNNLGFVHFTMDNHEEAERAYIQALQIWEETLGSDHPNVGASLNNLAALYEKAGDYKQAEKYKNRSKEIWQKAQEDASSKLANICDSMTEILFVCPTDNKK